MEHLSVAIADDNQRILDMLDDIIQTDKELDLVGKAKNGEEMCQIIKDVHVSRSAWYIWQKSLSV